MRFLKKNQNQMKKKLSATIISALKKPQCMPIRCTCQNRDLRSTLQNMAEKFPAVVPVLCNR